MPDKYLMKFEGIAEALGELSVDIENDVFTLTLNDNYNGPKPFFLRYPDAPMPLNYRIKMWVLGRAPELNNELINSLIKKAGLKKYDAYGFFKFNNGRFITDKFYVVPL